MVGASRSTSGKPILATAPHNGVDLAQQWYQAQVKCPDIDAIGAFFMGTPGIYLGHTRRSAWGVTNHTASARDLYVETVSKDDPDLYLENGRWLRFAIEQQEIPVRGQAADLLEIRQTVRGPVLSAFVPTIDEGPPPVLSLRWVGAEPTTGFESMLALMRSQSAAEIERALRIWPFPILNMLFADTDGHIGEYPNTGPAPTVLTGPTIRITAGPQCTSSTKCPSSSTRSATGWHRPTTHPGAAGDPICVRATGPTDIDFGEFELE